MTKNHHPSILFVCLGNICRSPLVEAVARRRFAEAGLGASVASCGTGHWHVGKGADPNHIKGGNEKLPNAIAKAIGEENISLNTQVTNVIDTKDGVEVRAVDTTNFDNRTYKAKYVVLTIPLFRLFEIQFTPALPQKIYDGIYSQTWGSYFTAHVIMKSSAKRFWSKDGESLLPILTDGPVGVIYGTDAESKDHTMINLLVTGDYAEKYNARTGPLDAVTTEIKGELNKLWPGVGAEVEQMTFVRYHPRAIASWPVGRSRLDALSDAIRRPLGRLYLAGDFTEGTHSDGASWSAVRVVRQVCAAEHVQPPPNLVPAGLVVPTQDAR